MHDPNCIFCKIAQKQIPAQIIYEDDISVAFLDINPVNEGHALVIPKNHFEDISSTPDEYIGKLFVVAKNLMPKIKNALNADFMALTIVGKDVPHFHIHLIPRNSNDGLAGFWPTKKYDSSEEAESVAQKIRDNLK